jgi:hypothetical protein
MAAVVTRHVFERGSFESRVIHSRKVALGFSGLLLYHSYSISRWRVLYNRLRFFLALRHFQQSNADESCIVVNAMTWVHSGRHANCIDNFFTESVL